MDQLDKQMDFQGLLLDLIQDELDNIKKIVFIDRLPVCYDTVEKLKQIHSILTRDE